MVDLNQVRQAMSTLRVIQFDYTDSAGEFSSRTGEPYEIRAGSSTDLFVWDYDRQEIRRFKVMRMSNLVITDQTFEPKFDIKP